MRKINFNINYSRKIDVLKSMIHFLRMDISDILMNYAELKFQNSNISKMDLFRSIIDTKSLKLEEKEYIDKNCNQLRFFKDRRTGLEYGIDLIIGWIAEDAVLKYLNKFGTIAYLNGEDRHREFLEKNKISTQPDLIIGKDSTRRSLELMNDWGGYWLKYNKLDLRYNKYEKLLKKEAIFLGISPSDNNAVVIDFKNSNDLGKWIKISSHFPYGGKPAMQLENVSQYFIPINNALNKVMDII